MWSAQQDADANGCQCAIISHGQMWFVREGCLLVELASVVCVPAFKMIKLKIVLSVRDGRYIFLIHLIIFIIYLNIYIFAPIVFFPREIIQSI